MTFGLFVILTFATIDLTRYFFSLHGLTTLVTAAARLGQGNPLFNVCDGPPSSWAGVATYAPLLDPNEVSLCVTQPFISLGVQTLSVTGTYNFETITPLLDTLMGPMTATVTYKF